MTPEQFAYWMQGFVEITGERPTKQQWKMIKEHLGLCFTKVTPFPGGVGFVRRTPHGLGVTVAMGGGGGGDADKLSQYRVGGGGGC